MCSGEDEGVRIRDAGLKKQGLGMSKESGCC